MSWRPHDYDSIPGSYVFNGETARKSHPAARRALKLRNALGEAIRSYPEDLKAVIFGTGGMPHQLQGERAGKIDVDSDLTCLDKIIQDPDWMADLPISELVEKAGTGEVKTIMWLAMRGVLNDKVNCVHGHCRVPVSSAGAGALALENT